MTTFKKALVCYYTYNQSILMIGSCNGKKLIAENCEIKTNMSINHMGTYLQSQIPTPTFKKGLWINNHMPLSQILKEAIIIDFIGNKELLAENKDALKSLHDEKRLQINFNPQTNIDTVELVLCMMVNVFSLRLSGLISKSFDIGYGYRDIKQCLDGDEDEIRPKTRHNATVSFGG